MDTFAKRKRGKPTKGRRDWQQRNLPAPHTRVIQAAIRTGDQLGPGWRRWASRLGVTDTSQLSVIADGAKWNWSQASAHLPGAVGVLDTGTSVGNGSVESAVRPEHLGLPSRARIADRPLRVEIMVSEVRAG